MKVKVLEKFKDKHTGKIHKKDKIIEISKERYDEILTVGKLVEVATEEEIAAAEKKPTRKTTKKESE